MRVVLADDHLIFMEAIRCLIEPEYRVIGTFLNGRDLVDNLGELNPDIAVIDIAMPTLNGISAATRIRRLLPQVRLVFLTMYEDDDSAAEAFRAGASGYVVKSAAASELLEALRTVSRGGYYSSPSISADLPGSFVKHLKDKKRPTDQLTPRQIEVLQLLTEGYSMKEIADILNITPRTVKFHKYSIMEILNISTTAELLLFGMKQVRNTRHR